MSVTSHVRGDCRPPIVRASVIALALVSGIANAADAVILEAVGSVKREAEQVLETEHKDTAAVNSLRKTVSVLQQALAGHPVSPWEHDRVADVIRSFRVDEAVTAAFRSQACVQIHAQDGRETITTRKGQDHTPIGRCIRRLEAAFQQVPTPFRDEYFVVWEAGQLLNVEVAELRAVPLTQLWLIAGELERGQKAVEQEERDRE